MFSLPKPDYQWTEPPAFRKAVREAKKRNPIIRAIPFLIYFGFSMLLWHTLIRGVEDRDFGILKALSLSAGIALFLTLCLHWLHDYLPSKVTLAKRAILRQKGNQTEVWRYDQLERCNIAGIDSEDAFVRLVLFGPENRTRGTIGIGKVENLELIGKILAANGLEVSIHSEPTGPWQDRNTPPTALNL